MGYQTNYTSLVNEILSITDSDNPELIDNLDKIIARAQDNVQRDLNLAIWRVFETASLSTGVGTFTRSIDWLKIFGVFLVSTGAPLEKRSLDYLRMYGTATGTPRYFAERSETQIQVAPLPSADMTLEVEAMQRFPSLSESMQENWISNNAADLLLLQTLIGAEMFLLGAEKSGIYAQMYNILLASARDELRGSEKSEYTPIRSAARPNVGAA